MRGPRELIERDTVLGLLRDLIRIPSTNPSIAPDEAHGEREVASFARAWLAERGVKARLEDAAPGRPNVTAEVGNGQGPTLALCAHLDTVGTAGMTIPPFDPKVDGDRVYGRGSYDMKGGAAAIMIAAAVVSTLGVEGRLLVALVADEEFESLGAADFVRRHRADGCILTEASEGRLILAHKGFVWADVTTFGRAAHGSRWELGVSAIGRMGPVIAALERHDTTVLRKRVHPLVGPASMHCSRIEGGVGLSTYAPECRLAVERRTLPGESADDAMKELTQVVGSVDGTARVELRFHRAPLLCDRDAPVARAVRAAAKLVTGAEPAETGVPYWMDAAVFAEAGIPAVNYGPSGAGAHEAVEWVELGSVVACARVLAEAALEFCGPCRGR